MKRITDPRKIAGKTIKKVGGWRGDGILIFAFEDGDWIQFDAEAEYDGGAYIDCDTTEDMEQLFDAGVITQEEYEARKAAKRERQERFDREQYEALKARFEGK